mgnify:CR=1 FL=1
MKKYYIAHAVLRMVVVFYFEHTIFLKSFLKVFSVILRRLFADVSSDFT